MSWPTWSAATAPIPTAVAGSVPSTLLPTPINSAPTVIAPMGYSQDQWAQAQQQNWQQWAQWQQQYQQWHQQYGAEYQKSLSAMQGTAVQVQPPLPALSTPLVPPLPVENKPPLPPEEPPAQHAVAFTAIPPGYATAAPALVAQTPVYQVQPAWQNTAQKRPYAPQEGDYNDPAKRMMAQKPPQAQWQGAVTNYSQPPPQAATQAPPAQPAKPNTEELSEAEKKFDKEFAAWEAQFNKWKEQNANHPDKTQYREYEKKWESWRNSLLERREQMRRKRLALCGQTTATPQKSEPLPEPSINSQIPKPALLGAYPGDKSGHIQTNDLFNKPPPNQNNEPLSFKGKSYQEPDVPEKEVGGFLTSSSSTEGIPGLDLVKDDTKEDLPDRSEETEQIVEDKPKSGPDFEAISKGINSILGDQKLLSMLSMVSQSAPPVVSNKTITTDSTPSNISNYAIPPPNFQQYPPNYNAPPPTYDAKSNKDDYYQQRNDKFDAPPPEIRRTPQDTYYGGLQRTAQDNFGPGGRTLQDNFGSGGRSIAQDDFSPGGRNAQDYFAPAEGRNVQDNFGPPGGRTVQDNYGPGGGRNVEDNFGPSGRNNIQDTFAPDEQNVQDTFGPGGRKVQENFGPGARNNIQDTFGHGGRNVQDTFGPGGRNVQDTFGPGGRKVQDNFGAGGRNVQDNFGPGRRNDVQDTFGPGRRNVQDNFGPGMGSRNSGVDRFNKFNDDNFSNNNRDRFNNKYDNYGEDNYDEYEEDYDQYNEDEDYDKYNEMFKDDDDEQYNDNYQQQPKIPSLFDITPAPVQHQHQDKIPSLMDMTPEPPQICPVVPAVEDEEIFEPKTVIDYEHSSKIEPESTVTVVPVKMYDYNHKQVNTVPHSERPNWLAEAFKFIREFDPSALRYERPPIIPVDNNRYTAPVRDDRFDDRDRYNRGKNRREKSFEKDNFYKVGTRKRSRDRTRDDFRKEDFGNRRKFDKDSFHDASLIENVEEISDSEMDFEQTEQVRHHQETEARKSRSPELSNPPNPSTRQLELTMIEDIINPPGRYNRPPRIVIILRGPPGSGKTYLAKQIKDKEVENGGSAPRILSLDDYFMVEHEKQIVEDGKTQIVKEMVYEYEADMEESYRQSFMKSFKKTITDGYFPFIIVDNVNDKVKHFGEMWSFAKQNGFQVYVCQMDLDPVQCTKRNVHNRSEKEIEEIISGWEPTPSHHPSIDASGLLQSCSITEVEMELDDDKNYSVIEETKDPEDQVRSKWDNFDCSNNNLAKLDGVSKPLRKSRTMEEYLQMDSEWEPPKSAKPGKKRVRWADLEEQRNVEKMKAIGFVVGHTDWERIMDPAEASRKALTQTKYIENVSRYKY